MPKESLTSLGSSKLEFPKQQTLNSKQHLKLVKNLTFFEEDDKIQIENKLLKFKLDRTSKEIKDLKYQMKVTQEVSNIIKNKSIYEEPPQKELENLFDDILNSNYYLIYLQKIEEKITNENNFKALIQNQGLLLRTNNIEIAFKNMISEENGQFSLKYVLYIKNLSLDYKLLENLWIVYKQPEVIDMIFPEISCTNMVSAQSITQEITINFRNLFVVPIIFDISYRFFIYSFKFI